MLKHLRTSEANFKKAKKICLPNFVALLCPPLESSFYFPDVSLFSLSPLHFSLSVIIFFLLLSPVLAVVYVYYCRYETIVVYPFLLLATAGLAYIRFCHLGLVRAEISRTSIRRLRNKFIVALRRVPSIFSGHIYIYQISMRFVYWSGSLRSPN